MEGPRTAGALAAPPECPAAPALNRLLRSALDAEGRDSASLTIMRREPVAYVGTYPSEVITCRFADGELRLLAKHSAGRDHACYGHRRGLAYEASVYRTVLRTAGLPTPRFFGAHTDPRTGETSLFVEYIDGAVRASWAPEEGLVEAVRWIARLHAHADRGGQTRAASLLARYDRPYYLGWAERTERFAGDLHAEFPWLRPACRAFPRVVPTLGEAPTVIHGEYYPKNVLVREGTPYPVDWESAAIGAGEIDLATITDGWPADLVARCESAYASTRWPEGPPQRFRTRLEAARIYVLFRWLGDRPEWTLHHNVRPLFARLEAAAAGLNGR